MRVSIQVSYDVGLVLRDLYAPGRRDPHGVPHLLGGSQEPASLEPERQSGGTRNTGRLSGWLNAPPGRPPGGDRQLIWHCIVQADPASPPLSDGQWRQLAADIMSRPKGSRAEQRWIAVRHGRAHIHILAAMYRGTRPAPGLSVVRAACRAAENRHQLTGTPQAAGLTTRRAAAGTLAGQSFPAACSSPARPDPGLGDASPLARAARTTPATRAAGCLS